MLKIEKKKNFEKGTSRKAIRKWLAQELFPVLNPRVPVIVEIILFSEKNDQINYSHEFSFKPNSLTFEQNFYSEFEKTFELTIFEFMQLYSGPYLCHYRILPGGVN